MCDAERVTPAPPWFRTQLHRPFAHFLRKTLGKERDVMSAARPGQEAQSSGDTQISCTSSDPPQSQNSFLPGGQSSRVWPGATSRCCWSRASADFSLAGICSVTQHKETFPNSCLSTLLPPRLSIPGLPGETRRDFRERLWRQGAIPAGMKSPGCSPCSSSSTGIRQIPGQGTLRGSWGWRKISQQMEKTLQHSKTREIDKNAGNEKSTGREGSSRGVPEVKAGTNSREGGCEIRTGIPECR